MTGDTIGETFWWLDYLELADNLSEAFDHLPVEDATTWAAWVCGQHPYTVRYYPDVRLLRFALDDGRPLVDIQLERAS